MTAIALISVINHYDINVLQLFGDSLYLKYFKENNVNHTSKTITSMIEYFRWLTIPCFKKCELVSSQQE